MSAEPESLKASPDAIMHCAHWVCGNGAVLPAVRPKHSSLGTTLQAWPSDQGREGLSVGDFHLCDHVGSRQCFSRRGHCQSFLQLCTGSAPWALCVQGIGRDVLLSFTSHQDSQKTEKTSPKSLRLWLGSGVQFHCLSL